MTIGRPLLGEQAPPIRLNEADGVEWRLEDHRGRSVVVIFHRHIH